MTRATLEQIRPLVAELVEQKLLEILGDPDAGLKVTREVRARLRRKFRKNELRPAGEVARRLGLKW